MPSLVHSAQTATIVNLCFVAAAFLCAHGLPRRLADQGAERGTGDADAAGDADSTGRGQPAGAEPGRHAA
jgi:hypothetical protein